MVDMKNNYSYYDILGLSKNSSDEDIKLAYLRLAKKHHPDNNPQNRALAAKRFQVILEAYNAIKTREKRALYNQKMRTAAENDNSKQSGIFAGLSNWLRPQPNAVKETHK